MKFAIEQEKFADYTIVRQIGKGGFGRVYEAVDKDGSIYALKLMCPTPFISSDYIKQIISNTKTVSEKCVGLNIVPLIKYCSMDESFYMLSNFFRRGSLEDLLKEKNLSDSQKLNLLISMANTLSDVHSRGIVHGDIKPSNFLISEDGIPFLTDFYFDINRASFSLGMPKGTIEYMSPEQAEGKLFSYKSDIYSLGVLAYNIFSGQSPFKKSSSIKQLIIDKINGNVLPPIEFNKQMNSSLSDLIMKAMHHDLKGRFASMKEFHEALKSISV
ncbi:MAG TPA: serine/threonine-protein kinase [Victivallales bacterium]|nr:serine/threonine-protein kinase [Victivallales bacterium]HRU00481.1 serine/threonine-protein kinase [Victivallales bacterium]